MPGTGPAPEGAPIPAEFAHLKVPMMPPDYRSPEPEIPAGFDGGRVHWDEPFTPGVSAANVAAELFCLKTAGEICL